MFGSGKNEEAMLYYLYMMSDGEVSDSEKKLFNKVCKELELDKTEKKNVISECRKIAKDPKDAFDVMVSDNLDEKVGQGWFGVKDNSALARIVWNLVNLGYADSCYSDEEKKIVNHLIEKWNVDKEVFSEMIDTADTILALTKQRDWILSSIEKDDTRDKKIKKIDSEIKSMLLDMKLTIEELTM